jgi:hypothetical protein
MLAQSKMANFWLLIFKHLMRKSGAWILSTYCKLYVKDLQTLYGRTLEISKVQNFEYVVIFFYPQLPKKSATRFILRIYGDICWTKFSFYHSESEFVWDVPLGLKISKFCVRSFVPGPQITDQKYHHVFYGEICWIKLFYPFWVGICMGGTLRT